MSEKNDHRLVEWDQIDFIKGLAASLGRVLSRSAWPDVVAVTGFICEGQILLSSSLR